MKSINQYILEKFQITKDSKPLYTCHPKYKFELREILEERLAEDKNADLNDIDVSQITDMKGIFYGLDPNEIHIEKWDVSNVTDMEKMFWKCKNFNCDLSNWDVSNVKNMWCMFDGCKNFEGEGLEHWKPINCKHMNMCFMFNDCLSLKNKPNWKIL